MTHWVWKDKKGKDLRKEPMAKEQESKKEMVVVALENGTVIDHIPSDKLFSVVKILGLDRCENQITIGNNLSSKKSGHKGIIKIADRTFAVDEINKIAVIAPNAVLNVIENYRVVEKRKIESLLKCVNPKCITNNERIKTRFEVLDKGNVVVKCHYCESVMKGEEVTIKG